MRAMLKTLLVSGAMLVGAGAASANDCGYGSHRYCYGYEWRRIHPVCPGHQRTWFDTRYADRLENYLARHHHVPYGPYPDPTLRLRSHHHHHHDER
jgi:hypothetical protein